MKQSCQSSFVMIGGSGPLPEIIFKQLQDQDWSIKILSLPGSRHEHLDPSCRQINLHNFLSELQRCRLEGAQNIVLVGGVNRLDINNEYAAMDNHGSEIAGGDDKVLRGFLNKIEQLGFKIRGINEFLVDFITHEGFLTVAQPSALDEIDALRAEAIMAALGQVDVGQATIVRNQICWGLETGLGTDWMLKSLLEEFVNSQSTVVPSGLLYKGSKANQDLRVDLPTIGLTTIELVHQLGLAGIVIESNLTIILDRPRVIQFANEKGLFLWSKVKQEVKT